MSYRLGPNTLRDFQSTAVAAAVADECQDFDPTAVRFIQFLAELYSNALEHGVIGLDSKLKSDPSGFAEYYQQREAALEKLSEGFVEFTFEHQPTSDGGSLMVHVADSGNGFEYSNEVTRDSSGNGGLHGRGITLIRDLCRRIDYKGAGNEVEAEFVWKQEA